MEKKDLLKKFVFKIPYKSTNEKFMLLSSFLLLSTATIFSIINNNDIPTIIPCHTVTIPIINGLSTLICFILFFTKENFYLHSLVLFVQGICTVLTGYELLGAFLYSCLFIILFCNKFFVTKTKFKFTFLCVCWGLALLGLIPFGWQRFILEVVISLFFAGYYAYIYKKLESFLSILVPAKNTSAPLQGLPERGSEIDLSTFDLSDRQIKILKDYMDNKLSYKEISEKYYISISTVKKDMADIFCKFNVKNINELYFLLSQFVIK